MAHYDDEVIAASARLGKRTRILHVTDSGPRNPKYFTRAGFSSRETYAEHRRQEMLRAVALGDVSPEHCEVLPVPDQEAVLHLKFITEEIRRRLDGVRAVLTHAYEGGHPDHDACALACQMAVSGQRREESPFYHLAGETRVSGEFLEGSSTPIRTQALKPEEQERKAAMFAEFESQKHIFERFSLEREIWRVAPVYDFLEPPHPGTLYYETRDLGYRWPDWRQHAQQFLRDC